MVPPTGMKRRSWSARSTLAWVSSGIVPISSRKRVPPLATSNRPFFAAIAEVNAPFVWPNNVDSSRSPGTAPVLIATKLRSRRGLFRWIAFAMSSLPVPLSPWINTVDRDGATCVTVSSNFFITSDLPMMLLKE